MNAPISHNASVSLVSPGADTLPPPWKHRAKEASVSQEPPPEPCHPDIQNSQPPELKMNVHGLSPQSRVICYGILSRPDTGTHQVRTQNPLCLTARNRL